MAKDASDIYGGPAKTVEIDTAAGFGTATDLGYAENVEITWTPNKHALGHGMQRNLHGVGKFRIEHLQTDDTTLTAVKAMRNTLYYARVTNFDDKVFPMLVPCLWSYEIVAPFKEGEPHKLIIEGQVATDEPDDFVNWQT